MKHTALYDRHIAANGKMVDFAGWQLPIHYGSQLQEHQAVREHAGMFDVSHMTIIDVAGDDAKSYLQNLVANDVDKLQAVGQALYGALLNSSGGVIDDLIIYRRERGYRLVTNAATRSQVIAWLNEVRAGAEVELNERADHSIIAIQGPKAVELTITATGWDSITELSSFEAASFGQTMAARTGYTGEDGVEIMLPGEEAVTLWQNLLAVGIKPIGLGARDTLRLEAGLNLSGQDMHEGISPLIANMGWTIAWQPEDRNFIGREALAKERSQGINEKLTGVVLEGKGVIRHGNPVHTTAGMGEVTSGIFSPTLGYSIALARLPKAATGSCEVEIRGKRISARIVKPPFVRHGKQTFK